MRVHMIGLKMTAHVLISILVVPMILPASLRGAEPSKAKSGPKYPKVEIRGILEKPFDLPNLAPFARKTGAISADRFGRIKVRPDQPNSEWLAVDLSELKGWEKKDLEKLAGHEVLVTGTFEFYRLTTPLGVPETVTLIVARTLKEAGDKGPGFLAPMSP